MKPETIAEPARPVINRSAFAARWCIGAIALLLVLLYAPVLRGLILQWWEDGNYSHGFLVPLFGTWVIWEKREALAGISARPSWLGLPLLLGSLGVMFLGLLGAELFLTRISLLGVIAGLVLFLHGWTLLRALIFPLGVLLLMIPLPAIVYNQIVFPLQLLASKLAEGALQTFHIIPVLREGNVLVLPNVTLEVAEACSGIRSLMTMLAISVGYGYFAERRTWLRVALCLAIVPIAVVSNAVRVMFAAVGSQYWGEAVVEGLPHLLSGIVLFVVATFAMIGVHGLLKLLARQFLRPALARLCPTLAGRSGAKVDAEANRCEGVAPGGAAMGHWRAWTAIVLLATASVATSMPPHSHAVPLRHPLAQIPLQIGAWQGTEYPLEPRIVKAAGVNDYINRGYVSTTGDFLSLYVGYYRSQETGDSIHSPKNCLPGGGWQPVRSELVDLRGLDGRRYPVNLYVVRRGREEQIVLYWYQTHGRIIASEYWAKFYMVADAIRWNRTEGALVRIATAGAGDFQQARDRALWLAQQVLPSLDQVLPQ